MLVLYECLNDFLMVVCLAFRFFHNIFSSYFAMDVVKQEDVSNAAAVELNSK